MVSGLGFTLTSVHSERIILAKLPLLLTHFNIQGRFAALPCRQRRKDRKVKIEPFQGISDLFVIPAQAGIHVVEISGSRHSPG